jgi:uncharacterized protein YukE
MIPADCPPGVVAGTLDSTVHQLRQVLASYRAELTRAAEAFQDWEVRWHERQREIDAHLELIQARLRGRLATPTLTVVREEE